MHVELKRQWINKADMARHLGALCNAAHGLPVAWVVGVDEKSGEVISSDTKEIANWWPQIQKHFDGQSPTLLQNLNVDFEGKTVCAFLFDSSLAPYVIKTPQGVRIEREVPWREGNRTISAKREHLISIIVPWLRAPKAEITSFSLDFQVSPESGGSRFACRWSCEGDIYIEQRHGQPTAFAAHKAVVHVVDNGVIIDSIPAKNFQIPSSKDGSTFAAHSIDGPGYVKMRVGNTFSRNYAPPFPSSDLKVIFDAAIANCDKNLQATCEVVTPASYDGKPNQLPHCQEQSWVFPPSTPKVSMPKPKLSELAAVKRGRRGQ